MTTTTHNTKELDISFTRDLERGKVGETHYVRYLEEGTYEIKTDTKAQETGNLYVEYMQENKFGEIKPSGIQVCTAKYWVFASPSGAGSLTIETSALRELIDELNYYGKLSTGHQNVVTEETNGSWGYLITPEQVLKKLLLLPLLTERESEEQRLEREKKAASGN